MDDVLLPLGGVEVNGQLNALGLVHSERQVGLLLQILKSETLQVLLSEGLGVEDTGGGGLVVFAALGRARVVCVLLRGVLLARAAQIC